MAENRGKQFEAVVKDCFLQVPGVSIDRLHDQTNGYLGSKNICDFIVYKKPYEYYIECKTIHGNTFPLSNITKNQWDGMKEKVKIPGVYAGVLCWWVDKDITMFLPIQFLIQIRNNNFVSVPSDYADKWILDCYDHLPTIIHGKKKRVFFDYDMRRFLEEVGETD